MGKKILVPCLDVIIDLVTVFDAILTSAQNAREITQEKITDSHFWVFKEYPQKSQIQSETSPNLGTWLGIPWLGLVSLCQILDFYGYSLNTQKYPKMGIRYFFLCYSDCMRILCRIISLERLF